MRIFIHKLDCMIDVDLDDTVHQEPVCFSKAVEALPYIESINIIGCKAKANIDGCQKIHAINCYDIINRNLLVAPGDLWILWGGWSDLMNWMPINIGHAMVSLHRMFVDCNCIKATLVTDERFPFEMQIRTKWGHFSFESCADKIVELSQCFSKAATIFGHVQGLPLFRMPQWSKNTAKQSPSKLHDLAFPTRDFHKLAKSRLKKIIAYHANDPELTTLLLGQTAHMQDITCMMSLWQYRNWATNITLAGTVPFYEVPTVMSSAWATIVIGDEAYERFTLIPNKLGEALHAGMFAFIDNDVDRYHLLFGGDNELDKMCYVTTDSVKRIKDIIAWFKQNHQQYVRLVTKQKEHIAKHFDLQSAFHEALVKHAKHLNKA